MHNSPVGNTQSGENIRALIGTTLRARCEQSIDQIIHNASQLIEKFCESPIERRLACELVAIGMSINRRISCANSPKIYWSNIQNDDRLPHGICVFFQPIVGDYRSDFIVSHRDVKDKRFVAVECDGHEFHEKTKEQAARDKGRDRQFQQLGLPVFRFTGHEIFTDARKCSAEIEKFLTAPRYIGS